MCRMNCKQHMLNAYILTRLNFEAVLVRQLLVGNHFRNQLGVARLMREPWANIDLELIHCGNDTNKIIHHAHSAFVVCNAFSKSSRWQMRTKLFALCMCELRTCLTLSMYICYQLQWRIILESLTIRHSKIYYIVFFAYWTISSFIFTFTSLQLPTESFCPCYLASSASSPFTYYHEGSIVTQANTIDASYTWVHCAFFETKIYTKNTFIHRMRAWS